MKTKNVNLNVNKIITYIDTLRKKPKTNSRSDIITGIWIPGIANGSFESFMEKMEELGLVEIRSIKDYKRYVEEHKPVEMTATDKENYLTRIDTCLQKFSEDNKDEEGKNFWIPRYGKQFNEICIIAT